MDDDLDDDCRPPRPAGLTVYTHETEPFTSPEVRRLEISKADKLS